MNPPSSIFDRILANPRRPWLRMGIILLLFLTPLAAALADGSLGELFKGGAWRGIFIPSIVIMYIILVSPRMARVGTEVIQAFRSLVLMEDDSFDQLINQAIQVHPRTEIIIFSGGAILGVLLSLSVNEGSFSWLSAVWFLNTSLMYGLLAWTIYGAVTTSRFTATLLHQPLQVDPFDTSPFEPIGRQSLLMALVFIGGIMLSLLFTGIQIEILRQPVFWLIYIPLFAIPVVIFFISMNPSHKVLADARNRELQAVQAHFDRSCRELLRRLDQNKDSGHLSEEINALVAYSQRLQSARTWPYNTTMLRTLVFSILIPGGTAVARIVGEMIFN